MRSIVSALGGLVVVVAGCSSSPTENVGQSNDAVDYICNESPAATLDGIPAYAYCGNFNVFSNNGSDTKSASGGTGWVQTEGGYGYQCVEYAVRYEHFKFSVGTGWGISYAYQMCNTHPTGIAKATTPVHGDLMIFAPGSCGADGTAGHVAVVDTVGSTTVKVVQENTAGSYTYNKSCASCWLHASANSGTTDPCATAPSNGLYCGQSTQFGGGTKDVLYDCQNGVTASTQKCAYGCTIEPPNTNNQCAPAPADAGSDAATTSDASASDAATASDAAPKSDSGTTQDAAPAADAGDVGGGTSGCSITSTGTSTRTSTGAIALGIAALAIALRRRRA